MDNAKELTSQPMLELLTVTAHRKDWKTTTISAKSFLMTPPPPLPHPSPRDDPTCQGIERN